MDHIPPLPFAVDGDGGAVGKVGDDGPRGGGCVPQVQRAVADLHCSLHRHHGIDERQAEKLCQRPGQLLGDGVHVALHPGGVLVIVVVPDLYQHRREPGQAHLPQGSGGLGGDLVGQGIDFPQLRRDELRRPAALGAAGIVKGDDAPLLPVAPLRRRVGMQGQIQVVPAGVGLPDGGGRRHGRAVAFVADAVGQQVRHQRIRQQVHVVLLGAAAGDVHIPVLGGRAQIDNGHMDPSFSPIYMVIRKKV